MNIVSFCRHPQNRRVSYSTNPIYVSSLPLKAPHRTPRHTDLVYIESNRRTTNTVITDSTRMRDNLID